MLFSSPVFLFAFLPLTIIIYYLSPGRIKNAFLLLASLLFYAWGEPIYIGIMILSIIVNYTCGVLLSRYSAYGKSIIAIGVALNILLLSTFKYTNFIIENINSIIEPIGLMSLNMSTIPLPIGISFFTFQAISYIVDVYRKTVVAEKNIINVALYISLFPQLIAGPIIRYHDISKQIKNRRASLDDFSYGCKRFIIGLFKKVVIADTLGKAVDIIYSMPGDQLTMDIAWWGIACFTLQVYFDFSAYSDMAIGLGRIFGFRFLENFNYPYISSSITEFWTRWHISFSNWIRDYLFKPLGGFRGSRFRVGTNLFMVFFLSGLWHGARWNFIIWGMIHGAFLVIEASGLRKYIKRLPKLIGIVYVMFIFMISAVFFRAHDIPHAVEHLKSMFSFNFSEQIGDSTLFINNELILVFIIGILISTPVVAILENKYSDTLARLESFSTLKTISASRFLLLSLHYVDVLVLSILLSLCSMYVAASTYQAFIYFKF